MLHEFLPGRLLLEVVLVLLQFLVDGINSLLLIVHLPLVLSDLLLQLVLVLLHFQEDVAELFDHHPDFLRLLAQLIAFAIQSIQFRKHLLFVNAVNHVKAIELSFQLLQFGQVRVE